MVLNVLISSKATVIVDSKKIDIFALTTNYIARFVQKKNKIHVREIYTVALLEKSKYPDAGE